MTESDPAPGPDPVRWVTAARRVVVAVVWLLTVAACVATVPLMRSNRELGLGGFVGDSVTLGEYLELLPAVTLVTVGGLIVLRARQRRYGWLLLGLGALGGLQLGLGEEYAIHAWYGQPERTLPFEQLSIWFQDQYMIGYATITLGLGSLFPDGRPAPQWRRPFRGLVVAWVLLAVAYALLEHPVSGMFEGLPGRPTNAPTGVLSVPPLTVIQVGLVALTLGSLTTSLGSMVSRWRSAVGELRRQVRTVLYAFLLVVVVHLGATVATIAFEETGAGDLLDQLRLVLTAVAMQGLVVAVGFAVVRHRLYQVDLAVNRTLVYTSATALVLAAYASVVSVVGAVMHLDQLGASIVATGVVAIVFEPVRRRVQRGVNRLMFGRRDDPVAVLSDLGDTLVRSASPDATLTSVASTITEALKVPGAAVDLAADGGWERRASAGDLSGATEVVPLVHGGGEVGRLVVARRSPSESLHAADRRLLERIAAQAGALVHGVRLGVELQHSREALVQAREEERRRLRRDLHDGLGPSLASQTFRLDAVARLLEDGPAEALVLIEQLKSRNTALVGEIRRLVYSLRPPALDELGLVGALSAHAAGLSRGDELAIAVRCHPDPLGPLSAAVEAAAYRIASEAITNVVRHAEASSCSVEVVRGSPGLIVRIVDDGIGIGDVTAPGVGTASMHERAQELGGTLEVSRSALGGTSVVASLPVLIEDAVAGIEIGGREAVHG